MTYYIIGYIFTVVILFLYDSFRKVASNTISLRIMFSHNERETIDIPWNLPIYQYY